VYQNFQDASADDEEKWKGKEEKRKWNKFVKSIYNIENSIF
jgi:hypothetical protein